MATLRDIRRRIRAVRSTQQITRAMYLVAAAKLKKAEEQARAGRPYAEQLRQMIRRVAAAVEGFDHPLLARREVRRVLLVLITGDRGLAGPYNANLIRTAQRVMSELEGVEVVMLPVGRKGRDFFRRRGVPFLAEVTDLGENISFVQARRLARLAAAEFEAGRVDEVRVIYSRFISAISQRPTQEILLPIAGVEEAAADAGGRAGGDGGQPEPEHLRERDYLLEPAPEQILERLLPRYVETQVYRSLVEAKASEHGARMTAMKNATDNAGELIETLTLDLNRARQAAITKEIAEIVGGAEALSG